MTGEPAKPANVADAGRAFEELALRQGLITREQLEECRRVRDNVVAQGLECNLEEVLLKKGVLSKTQVLALHTALGRGNKHAIEGYEILTKLGAGGQGAVYKARQASMDRFVAIKVLLPKYAKEKDGVHRFLREAQAIARLNHPNIVAGIDAGYSNGIYYYVMEYVEGEGLDRRIDRLGKIPWREAASIVKQIAAALGHAQENDLVHRDIKPGNIIITRDGTSKLTDLGMARFAGEDGLTMAGCVVGTPFYMSPEQARGQEKLDIRADLYSLGITLYQMLAGRPPFTGSDPLVVLNQHLKETVRFGFPDVPAELQSIGHRLTERDRTRRYASPAELIEDLQALESDRPLPHARAAIRARTSRVTLPMASRPKSAAPVLIGSGMGVLALVALVAVALSGTKEPSRSAPAAHQTAPPATLPAPPSEKVVPGDTSLADEDRAALAALARVRQYEADNPNDFDEIADRYADLVQKTAGTGESENVKKRAGEAKAALAAAVEKRKGSALQELQSPVRDRRYGTALEVLDRHARAFRNQAWKDWHAAETEKVRAAMGAEARKLHEISLAAEARRDHAGALAAMKELQGFGVPALADEASRRILAIETARRAAETENARKAEADASKLSAFLDRADASAGERAYEKIEPPALETEPAKELLKGHLARYRGAQEVLETAFRHVRSLKSVQIQMRDGALVSGRLEAVQERPLRLLVGGKAYDALAMSAASVAGLYRQARGAEAKAENVLFFAVLDGDAALAEENLKRKPVELEPRYKDRLRKASAARAETPAPPPRKEPTVAAKKPDAREVVFHMSDLGPSTLQDDIEFANDPASPGGRMVGVHNKGEKRDAPPEGEPHVLFKIPVQAGVPYKCWVHMKVGKPKGDSQANLVYVQFTNAVDKQGKEVFTLGTPDYVTVRAPAREGWTWVGRDHADPKSAEPLIHFRTTGEVTVRVSVGMDGVWFDQFVLSPARFFEKPPTEAVVPIPKR